MYLIWYLGGECDLTLSSRSASTFWLKNDFLQFYSGVVARYGCFAVPWQSRVSDLINIKKCRSLPLYSDTVKAIPLSFIRIDNSLL